LNTIGCICFAEICKLGQYWYQTGKECKDCVKGSYQDDLLMYECKVCSVNTTTREVAAVSPSNCTCEFISINLADNPDNTYVLCKYTITYTKCGWNFFQM